MQRFRPEAPEVPDHVRVLHVGLRVTLLGVDERRELHTQRERESESERERERAREREAVQHNDLKGVIPVTCFRLWFFSLVLYSRSISA